MKKYLLTLVNSDENKIILSEIKDEESLKGSDYAGLDLEIKETVIEFFSKKEDLTDYNGKTIITRIE